MGVYVAHLVLEPLCHANNEVVDDGADGSQSSNILALAVVNLDGDLVLLGLSEVDCQVTEVLDKLAYSKSHLVRIMNAQRGGGRPSSLRASYRWRSRNGEKSERHWDAFVPRGPSTVTVRVLMFTLTERAKNVSRNSSSRHFLYPQ